MPASRLLIIVTQLGLAALVALVTATADAQQQPRGQGGGPGGRPPAHQGGGSPGAAPGGAAPMQRQATEADADSLLDQGLIADPARIEAAKQKAAEAPPQTQDPAVLARFYFERGTAAVAATLQRQALEDFRRAADYARQAPDLDKSAFLMRLSAIESDSGRQSVAVKLAEEAIQLNPPSMRPRLLSFYATLAQRQLGAGNVEGADAALTQMRAQRRELENNPRFMSNPNSKRNLNESVWASARVLERKGQLTEAEAQFREAHRAMLAMNDPRDSGRLTQVTGALANNLRLQNRLAEAENEARATLVEVQRRFGASGLPVARSLMNLAGILMAQGRFAEAEGLARRAITMLTQLNQGVGGARQLLASSLAAQGKWTDAHREFETMRTQMTRGGFTDQYENLTRRNPLIGIAMLRAGQPAEGLQRLQRVYEETRKELGERHYATAEARGFYAMALAQTGSRDPALAEFRGASEILLSRSRESSDSEESQTSTALDQRVRLVLDGYIDLLADAAAGGNADAAAEAFRLADAARGRSVLRALAASAARSAASDPALGDVARRVQDAEKQIAALNGLLANAISARAADRDENAIKALRTRIDSLRTERGRLSAEIDRKFPDYARLVSPDPATIADVQKSLRPGEAMLAVFSGERRTYTWAVPKSGRAVMSAAALDGPALAESVTKLRKALDPNAATLEDIPAFDLAEANRLYAALLGGVEAGWKDASVLFTVPDGALGQLPLALLVTAPTPPVRAVAGASPFSEYRAVPWLARKVAVAQLPSVSSLAALRAVPAPRGERRAFIGFGDPWFSKEQAEEAKRESAAVQTAGLTTRGIPIRLRSAPKGGADFSAEYGQLPRLPDTADEVKSIAAALRAGPDDVVLGLKASPTTVKQMDLRNRRIVMFATHGLVPGDLAGLGQPALALSAPDVTGNPADGLLTVEDILALKLNADWVVLSACNTAAAQGQGAEAVSGLGRAFFYAGTRALLVSNWPVESTSARALTTDLFRRQVETPAITRAEAMRQAMLALIDGPGLAGADGKALFTYAHPIFWAPFSLVGDGGGS